MVEREIKVKIIARFFETILKKLNLMTYSLITKETKLSKERQQWIQQSGWDKYLAKLYYEKYKCFLGSNFVTEFNNMDQITRWFELSMVNFFFYFINKKCDLP
jgi:hypothetical protein